MLQCMYILYIHIYIYIYICTLSHVNVHEMKKHTYVNMRMSVIFCVRFGLKGCLAQGARSFQFQRPSTCEEVSKDVLCIRTLGFSVSGLGFREAV